MKDTYGIVIAGGMNPRIHHPSWYHQIGILDQTETDLALKSTGTFVTPPIAQIDLPKIVMICQENRWEIKTTEIDQLQRIQKISADLFDKHLQHTPLNAIGFNFNYCKNTLSENVGIFLAKLVTNSPLGLNSEHPVSGELTLKNSHKDHIETVNIKPFPANQNSVLIGFNFEYKFNKEGQFELGKVIRESYPNNHQESVDQVARILEAINHSIGA